MTPMEFSKYEATANDFIMLDRTSGGPGTVPALAMALCDRRRGVGADGVIEVLPSGRCDLRMRILNADGSEAGMCGNGIRALFLFALDRGIATGDHITVETPAGDRLVRRHPGPGEDDFSVEMGAPRWLRRDVPMTGRPDEEAIGVELTVDGRSFEVTCVSMGNPHCVLFVQDLPSCDVGRLGPAIEVHEAFPERTNVEFARVGPGDEVHLRVWERGVGETMACGTGACASVVAASLGGLTGGNALVRVPGGTLEVQWDDRGVVLTGGARHVFDGKTVE